ncbi:acyl-CoA thioesterase II [Rhodococcus rhodnii]|uniref:Acyl-CoA thioesterase 2 n=2 Tax=Rhodococcus rhodnii TaxID=38312 RepID=R7WPH1_9NOCA|nr:acyl-CoA thioesterase II [Rhodococcus rhodnii]EOM75874.1 acyl-CoA thioesterase II [Rhodococcus rhodnii LMG 5362]TXG91043.1 acyl-CoA thioesterase II [Rhodococcus rhodnii]
MVAIEQVLRLERLERDIFRGATSPSVLQRTFGGQVAGQALVSAVRTVDDEFVPHSLHGYFLRPGDPSIPTVYLVDRLRDGRSFVTRSVDGVQNGETIFSMSVSFHRGDDGIEHQDRQPVVPDPDELVDLATVAELADAPMFQEWKEWDIRVVPRERTETLPNLAAQQRVWIRYRDRLPDDPALHVCALAYMSDMTLLDSSRVPHQDDRLQLASLDHAMWFLRPFRADDWLLYDQTSPSAGLGRALTQGRIFDRDGRLVAAVVQEGLTRIARDAPPPSGADERQESDTHMNLEKP